MKRSLVFQCIGFLIGAVLLAGLQSCSNTKKTLKARGTLNVKVLPPFDTNFVYPEPQYSKPGRKVGIAFSGGGSRSAAATLGQLRALGYLNLTQHIDYISSVSGGSWASVPFTYLPDSISDDEFLGAYIPPENITWCSLTDTVSKRSLTYAMSHSLVAGKMFKYWFHGKGDETFGSILNEVYLQNIGLGDRDKYFSYDKNTLEEILARNYTLKASDFYLTRPGRPYHIINSTHLGDGRSLYFTRKMHMEVSPLYAGISYTGRYTGGGYIEPFGMDTKITGRVGEDIARVKPKQVFSLSDAMAMSGDAPGSAIYRNKIPGLLLLTQNIGMPEIFTWSVKRFYKHKEDNPYWLRSREPAYGDGGNLENLAVLPLMKRKVNTIIVFVNANKGISKNKHGVIKLSAAVSKLFGEAKKGNVQVLDNSNNEYRKLTKELYQRNERGEPLVATHTYKVHTNANVCVYSGNGYDSVQITWVYSSCADTFLSHIKDTCTRAWIRAYGHNQRGFARNGLFPNYNTFLNNKRMRLINFNIAHVKLLSHFSSWIIVNNRQYFEDIILHGGSGDPQLLNRSCTTCPEGHRRVNKARGKKFKCNGCTG